MKKLMMDRSFYDDSLKKTIVSANCDLFKSRVGTTCPDHFVTVMDR